MCEPRPLPYSLLEALLTSGRGYWIFDFDGTLVNLAATPDSIVVPPDLLEDLDKLIRSHPRGVAIVSGRSVENLMQYLPLPITLVGNHGAQWRLPGKAPTQVARNTDAEQALDEVRKHLTQWQTDFPGSFFEDKGATVSFHVRALSADAQAQVAQRMRQLLTQYPPLMLYPAHACWEVRPRRGPNKGTAVRQLLDSASKPVTPVVFGDDRTDEDAFSACPEGAMTIIVGSRRPTAATYQIDSPHQVRDYLHRLVNPC